MGGLLAETVGMVFRVLAWCLDLEDSGLRVGLGARWSRIAWTLLNPFSSRCLAFPALSVVNFGGEKTSLNAE